MILDRQANYSKLLLYYVELAEMFSSLYVSVATDDSGLRILGIRFNVYES